MVQTPQSGFSLCAEMHGWTDGSFLGLHCVMLITYVNIAVIGCKTTDVYGPNVKNYKVTLNG